MRAKLLFSAASVAGFMVLSVAALASIPGNEPAKVIPNSEIVAVTVPGPVSRDGAQIEAEVNRISCTESEEYLLARIAMAEAESEDTEGKALVMRVVLNRVSDDRFPDSIEAVIFQSGQFSPIANRRFDRVKPDRDCWDALEMIEFGRWDESQGATYFESKSESTWHSENLEFLFQHGKHYFYREKED